MTADLSRYDHVLALQPGTDLAVRSRAALAWQDEVLHELS
jgi:hypothetical protein